MVISMEFPWNSIGNLPEPMGEGKVQYKSQAPVGFLLEFVVGG
jgi:hypothetical protein